MTIIVVTDPQAAAFTARLLAFSRARIVDKESSPVMVGASLVLGGSKFREDFSTTIPDPEALLSLESLAATVGGALGADVRGPESVIYMPRKHRELPHVRRLPLLAHECHHAWLNQQMWPREPWFYAVNSESRTEDEVQCMVVAASVQRRLTGTLPDRAALVKSLTDAYHLSPPDGPLARELLDAAWIAFDAGAGVPPTPVAVEAHRILDDLGVGWAS